MRRIPWLLLLTGVLVATLAVGASAAPPAPPTAAVPAVAAPAAPPAATAVGAVAIGQLVGGDGPASTLDLRAGARAGHALGTLRFFCPMFGYYNGVVRALTVENGVISVSGGGALVKPDGTRQRVRFSTTIAADGKAVTFSAEGADGLRYRRSGTLEPGYIRVGTPAGAATHP
jgi:hypothetical protein